jgi:hypothetical protein
VSKVGWAVGLVELVIGGVMSFRGLRYGWAAGDSLSNVWGTVVILLGILAFAVPGGLLFLKSPQRWLAQAMPVLAVILGYGIVAQGLGLP